MEHVGRVLAMDDARNLLRGTTNVTDSFLQRLLRKPAPTDQSRVSREPEPPPPQQTIGPAPVGRRMPTEKAVKESVLRDFMQRIGGSPEQVLEQAMSASTAPVTVGSSLAKATSSILDNPAFKKWFGKSKLVDPYGEPVKLYHGAAHDIHQFARPLNWTTTGPKIGGEYADRSAFRHLPEQTRRDLAGTLPDEPTLGSDEVPWAQMSRAAPSGQRVYPLYGRMENPLDLSGLGYVPRRSEIERFLAEKGLLRVSGAPKKLPRSSVGQPIWSLMEDKKLQGRIRDAGFDGIILNDLSPAGRRHLGYATFEPNQLKSAIGNSTFSQTSPLITAGLAGLLAGSATKKQEP